MHLVNALKKQVVNVRRGLLAISHTNCMFNDIFEEMLTYFPNIFFSSAPTSPVWQVGVDSKVKLPVVIQRTLRWAFWQNLHPLANLILMPRMEPTVWPMHWISKTIRKVWICDGKLQFAKLRTCAVACLVFWKKYIP